MAGGLIILLNWLILKMSIEKNYPLSLGVSTVFLFFSCFMVWDQCFSQDEYLNTLDLYQTDTPVNCRFFMRDQGDSLWIYADVEFTQAVKDSSLWIKVIQTTGNQTSNDSISLRIVNDKQAVLKWGFTTQTLPEFLTLELVWKAQTWTFQEHFPLSAFHPSSGLFLKDSLNPIFSGWIQNQDSVLINTPGNNQVIAYFYHHEFDPARPPMTLRPTSGSGTLDIDTILVLPAVHYFAPPETGLYFFQVDSSSTLGAALLVTDDHYPQPQEIKELTEPLIYITTKSEYQKISNDLTNKQALDKFWLSTIGSPEVARRAIKTFYNNIEVANKLFSSYKEGWKTDRGMIYTVMGPPLSVVKNHDTETWTYTNIASNEMNFVFKKIRNIFSNNHYELLRDKSYDQQWFLAIDRWREGRIK